MQSLAILLALFLVLGGAFSQSKQQKQKTEEVKISTPAPSPQPTTSAKTQNNFQYPNSHVIIQNETSLTLESDGNADVITQWYKEKIKTSGMNTKSFVTTKTNGNVKNVLVGSDGKTEIRVEITKFASENTVRIVVTHNSY